MKRDATPAMLLLFVAIAVFLLASRCEAQTIRIDDAHVESGVPFNMFVHWEASGVAHDMYQIETWVHPWGTDTTSRVGGGTFGWGFPSIGPVLTRFDVGSAAAVPIAPAYDVVLLLVAPDGTTAAWATRTVYNPNLMEEPQLHPLDQIFLP